MDKERHCVICSESISERNDSREHLILNALGGRRSIRGFMCQDCNSRTGTEWDAPLVSQLGPFCVLLDINRSRGHVQPTDLDMIQTSWFDFVSTLLRDPSRALRQGNVERARVYPDGRVEPAKPTFSSKKVGSTQHIHMTARSVREMNQRLEDLKRKYPQLTSDDAVIDVSESESRDYVLGWNLPHWTHNDGRVITKAACALAVDAGMHPQHCDKASDFIRGDGKPCFSHFYDFDPILSRVAGMPLHVVHVSGDPKRGQLLGYVELFGCFRFGVCLSTAYLGEAMVATYAIDPTTGEEVDVDVDFRCGSAQIRAMLDGSAFPTGEYLRAVHEIMPTVVEASEQRALSRAVSHAIEYALSELGVDSIGSEHVQRFTALVMEKMTPYLVHRFETQRVRGLIAQGSDVAPFVDRESQ